MNKTEKQKAWEKLKSKSDEINSGLWYVNPENIREFEKQIRKEVIEEIEKWVDTNRFIAPINMLGGKQLVVDYPTLISKLNEMKDKLE